MHAEITKNCPMMHAVIGKAGMGKTTFIENQTNFEDTLWFESGSSLDEVQALMNRGIVPHITKTLTNADLNKIDEYKEGTMQCLMSPLDQIHGLANIVVTYVGCPMLLDPRGRMRNVVAIKGQEAILAQPTPSAVVLDDVPLSRVSFANYQHVVINTPFFVTSQYYSAISPMARLQIDHWHVIGSVNRRERAMIQSEECVTQYQGYPHN
jgi:hypothetical protein